MAALFPFTQLCCLHCHLLMGITDVSSLILVNLVCECPSKCLVNHIVDPHAPHWDIPLPWTSHLCRNKYLEPSIFVIPHLFCSELRMPPRRSKSWREDAAPGPQISEVAPWKLRPPVIDEGHQTLGLSPQQKQQFSQVMTASIASTSQLRGPHPGFHVRSGGDAYSSGKKRTGTLQDEDNQVISSVYQLFPGKHPEKNFSLSVTCAS